MKSLKQFLKESIELESSPDASSKTADHILSKEELVDATNLHIQDVKNMMNFYIEELKKSAANHDNTKISNLELYYKDFHDNQLLKNKFGTIPDFRDSDWSKYHYNNERHHIHARIPDDINLFDILESIADSTVAGIARTGKFNYEGIDPEILVKAYKNTIKLSLKNIK